MYRYVSPSVTTKSLFLDHERRGVDRPGLAGTSKPSGDERSRRPWPGYGSRSEPQLI